MERRVLLATLLSLGFLFLWQYITYKPQQQNVEQKPVEVQNIKEGEEKLQDFEPCIVETGFLKVVFNKYTAGIREVYVKEENKDKFTLLCESKEDSFVLNNIKQKFYVKQQDTKDFKKVIFYNNEQTIEYTFLFSEPYYINVKIFNNIPQSVKLELRHYVHSDKYTIEPNNVYICKKDIVNSKEISLVEKFNKGVLDKKLSWISVGSKYFISSVLLNEDTSVKVFVNKYDKNIKQVVLSVEKNLSVWDYKLLFVPKKISLLRSLGNKFIHTVDWGTFAPLSKLFYNILVYLYKIFKNYGLAIIGLTIILQIFTLPLTYNSIKSTLRMKKLQPQIQLLQKIYKDDPKRLNMEIMNLYKEKKVNPFGGCLPILLQIPIFWALFTMLRNTYDLRGAKFFLWINDLSQPDRLVIPGINIGVPVLVLLMGVTMFLQQVLSGSLSDPQQKTMAIMMPVIFTILFINFPSGLVLYWFINNLFSIAIQFIVNKTIS